MTKFILLGGYLSRAQDGGKSFADELVKGFGDSPKILLCFFARPQETWRHIFEKELAAFRAYMPNKNPEIKLAHTDTYTEQVRWADVIYMRGGITDNLIEVLKRDLSWTKELDGKTLAGSSAGADAIATHHFNLDTKTVGSGLGLLPVKVIPHWKSDYHGPDFDWDAAYEQLKSHGPNLPILTLAEGQFEIRIQ
jgi:peptidase E